jgi:hypothetical protein
VNINPDSAVAAYCAPGLKEYAISLLGNEEVREVIEDPNMAGRTDVVLATDPGWLTKPRDVEAKT